MKFLLVALNAKYIHSNLAVYSIRAFAKEYQEEVEIAEYTINLSIELILKDIYLRKPDMIGFSCYIWNITYIKEIIKEVHKLLPKTALWLGGPEVSYDAEEILEGYPELSGIMIGEGEKSFLQLLEYYKYGSFSFEDIQGLVYRALDGGVVSNPPSDLTNLSQIPFCYKRMEVFENRIIYYESSRGCPYSCSYCLSSIDKTVRFRNLELVKEELGFFLKHKVPQVKFVDRTFNCNHKHCIEIWNYILEQDNGITNFHFEISADILNEEELSLLKQMRVGLVQLEIGIQSANPHTIREIRRTMDLQRLREIVEQIHGFQNMHMHLDLIVGLPYEGYKSCQESFNQVYAMKPDQLQLGFLKVLKGSFMHQAAGEYEIGYRDNPPYEVLYTKWISYEEVLKLKSIEEIVEVYYNSGQFRNTIAELEKLFDDSFQMFASIAEYYESLGLFQRSHNRLGRYEILYQFVSNYKNEERDRFGESLMYDLYMRENIKSRPSFAVDQTPYKEKIKCFFIKEDKNRTYLSGYEGYTSRQISHMAHIEVFINNGKEEYTLFDYRNRNRLTYDAKVIKIEEEDL